MLNKIWKVIATILTVIVAFLLLSWRVETYAATKYIIDEQVVLSIFNYLKTRPYQEVAGGVQALQQLKVYQPVKKDPSISGEIVTANNKETK